jgi:type II secretory pathway component PulK
MMRARRQGFILLAALWLLVALGAVGLDAAIRSKARRLPAANALDETRAKEAALAGGEYARSRLTAAMRTYELGMRQDLQRNGRMVTGRVTINPSMADNPWRDPAQLMESSVTIGDLQFALDVHDTGTQLHINLATEPMLMQFFSEGLRIDYSTAQALAQAMMDWRDEDDLPRTTGGEREEYQDAGAVVLPSNRGFSDVDELRYVLGMTPELLEAMRPYLTVIGSGRINVNAAPVEVLSALPGFTHAHWAQLVRDRDAGQYPANLNDLRQMMGIRGNIAAAETQEFNRRASFNTNEVAIISEGAIEGSPVHARATMVAARSQNGAVITWRKVE